MVGAACLNARTLGVLPLISIEKIGEAAQRLDQAPGPRRAIAPLAGLRRARSVLASSSGPVAGRTLAAHGADVLLISGPDLPPSWLAIDPAAATDELQSNSIVDAGSERVCASLASADIFLARLSSALARAPRGFFSLAADQQDQSPGNRLVALISVYGP